VLQFTFDRAGGIRPKAINVVALLGHLEVSDKSNEIPAPPALIEQWGSRAVCFMRCVAKKTLALATLNYPDWRM
jgi:hypothetical protein